MNLGGKSIKSGGDSHLRSSSQKGGGSFTPWPSLEVLSRTELVQMIYKHINGGSWTVGSKVTLMCRVHALQMADFVYSKRDALEMLALQAYRQWRMGNESLLGSVSDPDSSKYLLAPPNLFTGEYIYFGFEVLMEQKKDTLIEYIRDHFCGPTSNCIKGRLACRIRVFLRFSRENLDASTLKAYEEEQLDVLRNYLSKADTAKTEVKQQQQRMIVTDARNAQPLITGAFSKRVQSSVQCSKCRGEFLTAKGAQRQTQCAFCLKGAVGISPLEGTAKGEPTEASSDSQNVSLKGTQVEGVAEQVAEKLAKEESDQSSCVPESSGLGGSQTHSSGLETRLEDGEQGTGTTLAKVEAQLTDILAIAVTLGVPDVGQLDKGDSSTSVYFDHTSAVSVRTDGGEVGSGQDPTHWGDKVEGVVEEESNDPSLVPTVDRGGSAGQILETCLEGGEKGKVGIATMSTTTGVFPSVIATGVRISGEVCTVDEGTLLPSDSDIRKRVCFAGVAEDTSVSDQADNHCGTEGELVVGTERRDAVSDFEGDRGGSEGYIQGVVHEGSLDSRALDRIEVSAMAASGSAGSEACTYVVRGGDDNCMVVANDGAKVNKVATGSALLAHLGDMAAETRPDGWITTRDALNASAVKDNAQIVESFTQDEVVQRSRPELSRLAAMYASQSDDSGLSEGSVELEEEPTSSFESLHRWHAGEASTIFLTPLSAAGAKRTSHTGGMGIPDPVTGTVPTWDLLLGGSCKGADLRGYMCKHFPHVNLECSTPSVAAKIRVLLRHYPRHLTNIEVDELVRSGGDDYKEWYQHTVKNLSTSSVSTLHDQTGVSMTPGSGKSHVSPGRFSMSSWADSSSDEDVPSSDRGAESGHVNSDVGLLKKSVIEVDEETLGPDSHKSVDSGQCGQSGEVGCREERGAERMLADVTKFTLTTLMVESDWVGAAAFVEYSRLILSQPEVEVGKRSRGLLLSSMTEALSMITGHEFNQGPFHLALLEVGNRTCCAGWSDRMICLTSPLMGAAIREAIGNETRRSVEYVFEIFYRFFFLHPNKFHYSYGKVFASMHGYQIQIWTIQSDRQYVLVESYGSGVVVSRWLVRDLLEIPSFIDLLIAKQPVQCSPTNMQRIISSKVEASVWKQVMQTLGSMKVDWVVEGIRVSSDILLQIGSGGQIPHSIILIWSRLCQRINSGMYIQTSKTEKCIESVWFVPTSMFDNILTVEQGIIMGFDVLRFPMSLSDIERLHARVLFAPYCSSGGKWGAGILHIVRREAEFVECRLYPGTSLLLQAFREWYLCQYAMKYDGSLLQVHSMRWKIRHSLGESSLSMDGYDSGVQLMYDMLMKAVGLESISDICRSEVEHFRRYVILVLTLPAIRRNQWIQDVFFDVCGAEMIAESLADLNMRAPLLSTELPDGGRYFDHCFDFRHEEEKALLGNLDLKEGKVMSMDGSVSESIHLESFPIGLLKEAGLILTERFTFSEMWLIEHKDEFRNLARTLLSPVGLVLGAVDFSIIALVRRLESTIFVEVGEEACDLHGVTSCVTLEWWLWANLCSQEKFCWMLERAGVVMSMAERERMWRRADVDMSLFTLTSVISATQMELTAPLLGFLSSTFPRVLKLVMTDLEESPGVVQIQELDGLITDTGRLGTISDRSEICVESCDLRIREAFACVAMCIDGLRELCLEGRVSSNLHKVSMNGWSVVKDSITLIEQFDLSSFCGWWHASVACDIQLTSLKFELSPLNLMLMLERFDSETKLDHNIVLDVKHIHLLRSLRMRVNTSSEQIARAIVMVIDKVVVLLLDKRVEDARIQWGSVPFVGTQVVEVCITLFPKVAIAGQWSDQTTRVFGVTIPAERFVILCPIVQQSGVVVVAPDSALLVLLKAMDRQVMYAVALNSMYGISIDVLLDKYWSMPRGIMLQWIDEGKATDEVLSKRDSLRRELRNSFEDGRPLWMVLGLAPRLEMMMKLSEMEGTSFSQAEITSVRCRDSLRTLLAHERASIISFSQAESDYPLAIGGSFGRRTLESMAKDRSSVVSMLIRKAKEGRSLGLLTMDHYSTPAEYSTKTLRSMFSVLQWLGEHNIISTDTTIEFKNVRASEMTEAFFALLGKDFVISRLPMDRSPWVEISFRYTEWLRRRGVYVASNSVEKQFCDSVPGQEILRLKWQGHKIPTLPIQDTDITNNQLSSMGLIRFASTETVEGALEVGVPTHWRQWLCDEVFALKKTHICVDIMSYHAGKGGSKQALASLYPIVVLEAPEGVIDSGMRFALICGHVHTLLGYRATLSHPVKGALSLCGSIATRLGWGTESLMDMSRLVQAMLDKVNTLMEVLWKPRSILEATLSSIQQTLDAQAQEIGGRGVLVWEQFGNLGFFEKGEHSVDEDFTGQLTILPKLIASMIHDGDSQAKHVLLAFRRDNDSIFLHDEITATEVQGWLPVITVCVVGKRGEDTVYQLFDLTENTICSILRGMQECSHTLTEAMISQVGWKERSLSWYHKEWKLRVRWGHLMWKEFNVEEICHKPWVNRRGGQSRSQRKAQAREREEVPKESAQQRTLALYDLCKQGSHVHRLGFTEVISADKVVVSGFHTSCLVSDVVRQISITLHMAQLPTTDALIHSGVAQGGRDTSGGLKMYVISMQRKVRFCSRVGEGSQYFFSLLSDAIHVKYGQATRKDRFLIMVSPCPSWLVDLSQPAFVSRGHSGVDSTDMMSLGALGWIFRNRLPPDVGDLAFVRVQIRAGFSVSYQDSSSSPLLRYANETVLLHFSVNGVQQQSLWSWLERQHHWVIEQIKVPKQAKAGRVLLRDCGSRFDLWKSCKQILGSGYEHIIASSDVVRSRAITILSCRQNVSPTDVSFQQLLSLWETQTVNLASIASIGWVSSKMEGLKGRKRTSNRSSHLSILWAGETSEEFPVMVPELPGAQLDVEGDECVEGMWRSSIALEGYFVSLLPGNLRNYFIMPEQTLLPRKNAIIRELLVTGWGRGLDAQDQLQRTHNTSPASSKSVRKKSVTYAAMVEKETGVGGEETSATTCESSSQDVREDSKLSVSTLSSVAGEDKVWQELSKLREDITKLQRVGDPTETIAAFEDRVRQVEVTTKALQLQQDQTACTLTEVQQEGLRVSQVVNRMEGRLDDTANIIRDVRDMLQRQTPALPPLWMNPAVMMEYYRTQIQAESQTGRLLQNEQRLHGTTTGRSAGADNKFSNE